MKRSLGSSDSLGALMSICPSTDEHSPRNNTHVYSREFQTMLDGLDEEGCVEESGHATEKKRRLSVDQVKALEKNFEVENKLEPERKVKLAQELGLQPRQVAVWFQNRRARWKTKQLERDYGVLKANYDAVKLHYEALQQDNESLKKEIRELKAKLNENTESNVSVKEEVILAESDDKVDEQTPLLLASVTETETQDHLNCDSFDNGGGGGAASLFPDFKDGSSDSDSSAILNEDQSPHPAISSHHNLVMSPPPASATLRFISSSTASSSSPPPSMNCFQVSNTATATTAAAYNETQFVKMEEHNFFGSEEACNFFSDEQAPTLHWYLPEQWN